ncbi:transcription elongation factor GreA [Thermoflexus sp.]|uniref:transcription elongation factor GreA n=1 Tax=Thermoflexus sp. TaxID=1969742 RepID=UPI001764B250|nr:transcription elongation factor GreA [Thermoflexus sp.]
MAAVGPTYLTPEGKRQLEEELEYLRTIKRREIAQRLRFAIQQGDLSENADYHAAKEEQAFIEGRIRMLEAILNSAVVIEPQPSEDGRVRIGSRVTIAEDGGTPEVYVLVGPAEADPTQGKISYESPLGQALLGRAPGDVVTVEAPAGLLTFRILAVE